MDSLDLTVVAATGDANITLVARRGTDIAVDTFPAADLVPFAAFRQRLERAIRGSENPLSKGEVQGFGKDLFKALARDLMQPILAGLPKSRISFNVLSNRADFQSIPWEYLQEPGQAFGPNTERCVVRVVPTVGVPALEPLKLDGQVRVLFVAAAPVNQGPVSFLDVKATIERRFGAELEPTDRFEFETIEAATPKDLATHLQTHPPYHVVHFCCHGEVVNGEGRILLLKEPGHQSIPLTSNQLCVLLRGRGLRLVVLSACETSAGDFASDFSVISDALVRCGVPAVVANQFPVHDSTVAKFVGSLYQELLKSGDIDAAVSEGRVALAVELEGDHAVVEWGIPTLHRHVSARQVFSP